MNLILFDEAFETVRLNAGDSRAQHLRKVLRADVGTLIFIGFINGARARAKVIATDSDGSYELRVIAEEPVPKLLPITLIVGLPRPHTARRILFEAASLGVAGMHFFEAEHSESSYAKSRLWQTDEWRERIIRGTEQAFGTHLPKVELHADMQSAVSDLRESATKVALDNYEASESLGSGSTVNGSAVAIAVGPERGWSAVERSAFRSDGWRLASLGPHVLRTETACVAAVAVLAAKSGFWKNQTETHI